MYTAQINYYEFLKGNIVPDNNIQISYKLFTHILLKSNPNLKVWGQ